MFMPSFDVVSEVDMQEVRNAVDQANREIANRFDFKGTDAGVDQAEDKLTVRADSDFQVDQARDILLNKLVKRQVDIKCLEMGQIEASGGGKARQLIQVRQGIDQDLARKLIRLVKDSKLKVQASIQGDKIRVAGKKRDDLQSVISLFKAEELDMPLQYINFRD
jgi:uncharacterized protein YajQ (UPF0234 family)